MAKYLVRWLLKVGAISYQDKELYNYAIVELLNTFYLGALIVTIGSIRGALLTYILLIVPYTLLRKFSGGFHFRSPSVCVVASSLLLCVFGEIAISGIKCSRIGLSLLVYVVSSVNICVRSPIENESHKLNEQERRVFKVVVIMLICAFFGVIGVLVIKEYTPILIPLCWGVALVAFLQVVHDIHLLVANNVK